MKANEHQEQSALIAWAEWKAQKDLRFTMLFAIPNAEKRSFGALAYRKKEGLKPGVPDLFLAVPSQQWPGLFIEMKSKTGALTDSQKTWEERLLYFGYKVVVCRSCEEAQKVILEYLKG